jgi:hypothetical protein
MPAYFIDFDSWIINAKDPDEAWDKALALIKQGKLPNVCGTDKYDDVDSKETHPDELYNYIQLPIKEATNE